MSLHHLLVQGEKERSQRVPLLTSSTESFRSGLTGYAQLQAPKSTSPQKATRVCLLPAVPPLSLTLLRPSPNVCQKPRTILPSGILQDTALRVCLHACEHNQARRNDSSVLPLQAHVLR